VRGQWRTGRPTGQRFADVTRPPRIIVIAQRAGETDEEIAHVTGYTVPMIRAVLRSS
jgi:hypothetical protein